MARLSNHLIARSLTPSDLHGFIAMAPLPSFFMSLSDGMMQFLSLLGRTVPTKAILWFIRVCCQWNTCVPVVNEQFVTLVSWNILQ